MEATVTPNSYKSTRYLKYLAELHFWTRYKHEIYFLHLTNMSILWTLSKKEVSKTQVNCRRLVWLHLEGNQNRPNLLEHLYPRRDPSTARAKYSGKHNQYKVAKLDCWGLISVFYRPLHHCLGSYNAILTKLMMMIPYRKVSGNTESRQSSVLKIKCVET